MTAGRAGHRRGPMPMRSTARYRGCVEQVRANPEAAVEAANAWLVEGGGIYARQCLGLAYVALERWAPAATAFEQAARGGRGRAAIRAAPISGSRPAMPGSRPASRPRAVLAFDARWPTPS